MSTNPPQGPPQPPAPPPPPGPPQPPGPGTPQPPYTPPPVDPVAEAKKRGNRNLAIVSVLSIALIVGAFFLGKSLEKQNYDPGEDGYNKIYAAGQQSGNAAGTATGKEEGVAEGTESGKKSGIKEGKEQGETQGQADGASAALGGFSDWSTGTPYVVEFTRGPNAQVPFAIDSRTLMQVGTSYKICDSGKGICTTSASSSSGGVTGGP